MLHPDTELASYGPVLGFGLRATRAIPRGTLVWVQCALDQVIDPAEVDALPAAYRPLIDRYAYHDSAGRWVLCWDHARYFNHHCEPNTRGLGTWGQIAVRDIEPGDPVTCDYGELSLERDLQCACGSARCRGIVRASDVLTWTSDWDRETVDAVRVALGLEQPLLAFLTGAAHEQALAVLRHEQPPPSIRELAFLPVCAR